MKKTLYALVGALLISSAFGAQTLTYNLDTITTGGTTPVGVSPWMIVNVTELTTNSVVINITSNLSNSEFFSDVDMDLSSVGTFNGPVTFTNFLSNGAFTPPTTSSNNSTLSFAFETTNSGGGGKRFNLNDNFSYTVTGLNIGNFNDEVAPVAHIQSLVDGTSSRITVPEPTTALLGALGILTLLRRRR